MPVRASRPPRSELTVGRETLDHRVEAARVACVVVAGHRVADALPGHQLPRLHGVTPGQPEAGTGIFACASRSSPARPTSSCSARSGNSRSRVRNMRIPEHRDLDSARCDDGGAAGLAVEEGELAEVGAGPDASATSAPSRQHDAVALEDDEQRVAGFALSTRSCRPAATPSACAGRRCARSRDVQRENSATCSSSVGELTLGCPTSPLPCTMPRSQLAGRTLRVRPCRAVSGAAGRRRPACAGWRSSWCGARWWVIVVAAVRVPVAAVIGATACTTSLSSGGFEDPSTESSHAPAEIKRSLPRRRRSPTS